MKVPSTLTFSRFTPKLSPVCFIETLDCQIWLDTCVVWVLEEELEAQVTRPHHHDGREWYYKRNASVHSGRTQESRRDEAVQDVRDLTSVSRTSSRGYVNSNFQHCIMGICIFNHGCKERDWKLKPTPHARQDFSCSRAQLEMSRLIVSWHWHWAVEEGS